MRKIIDTTYGGDEFMIVFVNCSEQITTVKMNEMRCGLLSDLNVSISFGVSLIEVDTDKSIKLADTRMYEDKNKRKMRCE